MKCSLFDFYNAICVSSVYTWHGTYIKIISNMFRYKCTVFRENKMSVLKTNCYWKAVFDKVLRSAATSSLILIKYKSTTSWRFEAELCLHIRGSCRLRIVLTALLSFETSEPTQGQRRPEC